MMARQRWKKLNENCLKRRVTKLRIGNLWVVMFHTVIMVLERIIIFIVTAVEKIHPSNSGDLEVTKIRLFNHSSLIKLLIKGRIASSSSVATILLGNVNKL